MADKPTAVIAEPAAPLRERAPIVSKPPRARSQALLPFVAAAVLVAAWQILAQVFSLPIYIAPTPMQVARTLVSELPTLLREVFKDEAKEKKSAKKKKTDKPEEPGEMEVRRAEPVEPKQETPRD